MFFGFGAEEEGDSQSEAGSSGGGEPMPPPEDNWWSVMSALGPKPDETQEEEENPLVPETGLEIPWTLHPQEGETERDWDPEASQRIAENDIANATEVLEGASVRKCVVCKEKGRTRTTHWVSV